MVKVNSRNISFVCNGLATTDIKKVQNLGIWSEHCTIINGCQCQIFKLTNSHNLVAIADHLIGTKNDMGMLLDHKNKSKSKFLIFLNIQDGGLLSKDQI